MSVTHKRLIRLLAVCAGCLCTIPAIGAAQGNSGAPDQFHVGDRIALSVEGPAGFSDTVLVRDSIVIQLPSIGEIPLRGVRRADAQQYLTQAIAKFVKDPVVHATPLIRVAVLGAVARPGYYSVPSDLILSDVLMRAGGPGSNSDIDKTVIKRGTQEVVSQKRTRQALASGATLDDLRIAPGDQIVVGEQSKGHLNSLIQITGLVVGLAGIAVALVH
jgi:polysaccharide export outer membrane protein